MADSPTLYETLPKHELSSLREQVRTLTADNAAMLRAGNWLAHERSRAHPEGCMCGVCQRMRDVFRAEHPGAALLAEMEALRKQVEGYKGAAERSEAAASALRARVAELERRQIEDAGRIADREAIDRDAMTERDAAQLRVVELEKQVHLLDEMLLGEQTKATEES